MQDVVPSKSNSLRHAIEELIEPLERAQLESEGESGTHVPRSLDLIMGELTMIALLFTNVDLNIKAEEVDFINDMRRTIYGEGCPLLTLSDYEALCRQFLHLYPKRLLTIDHLPKSIRYLLEFDRGNSTKYADKARAVFVQFAEAIISADRNVDQYESMTLSNFKDVLYSS